MTDPSTPDPRAGGRAFSGRRPGRIVAPVPGQVSVWDFPRPPRVEPVPQRVRIEFGGRVIADSGAALRVCETASPPCYYVPPGDVRMEYLEPSDRGSFCEWKGLARYWTVRVDSQIARDAAWSYPEPDASYEAIRDYVAFYPRPMAACWVGEQRVEPQPGRFYGGWITPELVGPFKGEPGTEAW